MRCQAPRDMGGHQGVVSVQVPRRALYHTSRQADLATDMPHLGQQVGRQGGDGGQQPNPWTGEQGGGLQGSRACKKASGSASRARTNRLWCRCTA